MEQEPAPPYSVDGCDATAMYYKDTLGVGRLYYYDIHAEAIENVLPLWPSTDR
jgi:hypothetical protein